MSLGLCPQYQYAVENLNETSTKYIITTTQECSITAMKTHEPYYWDLIVQLEVEKSAAYFGKTNWDDSWGVAKIKD